MGTTYETVHVKVALTKGVARAYECVSCGEPAAEWAFNHRLCQESTMLNSNASDSPYCSAGDPDHYMPLCKKCHAWFDSWKVHGYGKRMDALKDDQRERVTVASLLREKLK